MQHFLVCMFQEFGCDGRGVNAGSHEIVALVAQHADDLGSECFIQQLDHDLAVGCVAGCHGAFLDVLPRALAQGRDIGQRRSRLGDVFKHGWFHLTTLCEVTGLAAPTLYHPAARGNTRGSGPEAATALPRSSTPTFSRWKWSSGKY